MQRRHFKLQALDIAWSFGINITTILLLHSFFIFLTPHACFARRDCCWYKQTVARSRAEEITLTLEMKFKPAIAHTSIESLSWIPFLICYAIAEDLSTQRFECCWWMRQGAGKMPGKAMEQVILSDIVQCLQDYTAGEESWAQVLWGAPQELWVSSLEKSRLGETSSLPTNTWKEIVPGGGPSLLPGNKW